MIGSLILVMLIIIIIIIGVKYWSGFVFEVQLKTQFCFLGEKFSILMLSWIPGWYVCFVGKLTCDVASSVAVWLVRMFGNGFWNNYGFYIRPVIIIEFGTCKLVMFVLSIAICLIVFLYIILVFSWYNGLLVWWLFYHWKNWNICWISNFNL